MLSSSKCTCECGKCDKISAVSEQLGYVEMAVNVDIYGTTSGKSRNWNISHILLSIRNTRAENCFRTSMHACLHDRISALSD